MVLSDPHFHVTVKRFSEVAWVRWKPRLNAVASWHGLIDHLTIYRWDDGAEKWMTLSGK